MLNYKTLPILCDAGKEPTDSLGARNTATQYMTKLSISMVLQGQCCLAIPISNLKILSLDTSGLLVWENDLQGL